MSIKMRVLVASNKAKMMTLANSIKQEFELGPNAVDKIPPAYSCDKERIVILAISTDDNPKANIINFCKELNKTRAANVALLIDGSSGGAEKFKNILSEAGTNVIEPPFYTKCGLSFLKNVKPEENTALIEWVNEAVKNLK